VKADKGCGCIVMVVMFLIVALATRFIAVAPIVLFIVVFLIVRKIKTRTEQETREQQDRAQQNQKYSNHHEERKAHKAQKVNTVITCDYCGARVDTEKHACCDHCGGPFYDDEEWKEIQRRRRGA